MQTVQQQVALANMQELLVKVSQNCQCQHQIDVGLLIMKG